MEAVEALLDGSRDDARRGRLAIVRAQRDIVVGTTANGPERIRDAIALFERRGDPANEARARWALFMWQFVACGQFTAAEATARRMLACAQEAGSPELEAQAIRALASALGRVPIPASAAADRLRALLPAAPDAVTQAAYSSHLPTWKRRARTSAKEERSLPARASCSRRRGWRTSTGPEPRCSRSSSCCRQRARGRGAGAWRVRP